MPTIENALGVRTLLARLISDVYNGRVNPKIASGLAPLLNLQLRAIETTGLDQRLTRIEKLLAEAKVEEDRDLETVVPELDFGDLPSFVSVSKSRDESQGAPDSGSRNRSSRDAYRMDRKPEDHGLG